MAVDRRALESDVLDVMRARLSRATLLRSDSLRTALNLVEASDDSFVSIATESIKREVESLPDDLVEAARLMAGLAMETRGALVQRDHVLDEMSRVLRRRSRSIDVIGMDTPLTARQIYNIERVDIARRIADSLMQPKRTPSLFYEDVDVEVTVDASADPNILDVGISLSLTYLDAAWVVAVAPDAIAADLLCKNHLQINEVLCPSPGRENPEMSLWTRPMDALGSAATQRKLEPVSLDEICEHVPSLETADTPDVLWFLGWCHDDDLSRYTPFRLTFSSVQEVYVGAHHVYWSSPRLMKLQTLSFRWKSFPDASRFRFRVEPFLENLAASSFDVQMKTWKIEVNDLVRRGSGAVLIWGDADT
jgi:hypothetical protein